MPSLNSVKEDSFYDIYTQSLDAYNKNLMELENNPNLTFYDCLRNYLEEAPVLTGEIDSDELDSFIEAARKIRGDEVEFVMASTTNSTSEVNFNDRLTQKMQDEKAEVESKFTTKLNENSTMKSEETVSQNIKAGQSLFDVNSEDHVKEYNAMATMLQP